MVRSAQVGITAISRVLARPTNLAPRTELESSADLRHPAEGGLAQLHFMFLGGLLDITFPPLSIQRCSESTEQGTCCWSVIAARTTLMAPRRFPASLHLQAVELRWMQRTSPHPLVEAQTYKDRGPLSFSRINKPTTDSIRPHIHDTTFSTNQHPLHIPI
jgi:hypothetical protein